MRERERETPTQENEDTRQQRDSPQNTDAQTRRRGENTETETASETSENETAVDVSTCEECGGKITPDPGTQELICEDCGLVIDEQVIDHGPEWRAYSATEQQEKARTGLPLTELRHDKGLTTDIDWKNKDAYGRRLSSRKRQQMSRLRKWDFRAKRDSKSNAIAYANGEIKRMGSALGVPKNTQKTAAALYREAHDNELVPGRSIEGMASACLYIALRIHNEPRSLDEVTTVARIERKPLQRAYRYICRELSIGLEPTDPARYVPRFATDLNAPQEMVRTAESLLGDLNDTHHVSGNDPTVLAAAALYAASILQGSLLTQSDVRDASGVTEVSIRNNYEMFLIHGSASPLTEEHLQEATTPLDIAKTLHGEVTYLDTDENPGHHTTTDDSTTDANSDSDTGENSMSTDEHATDNTTDTETESPELECDECGVSFDTEHGLTIHRTRTHDSGGENSDYPDTDYNFSCPVCPRVTKTYVGVTTHIGHVHDEYDSDNDDRSTYAVDAATHPLRNADGEVIEDFTCEYCDEDFDTYWGLRIHQGRVHNGKRNNNDEALAETPSSTEYPDSEFNFTCTECPCVFDTYQGLRIHVGHEHPENDDKHRSAYAVNPDDHPVVTAADLRTQTDDSPLTIGETNTQPLGAGEARNLVERVDEQLNSFDHDFHPAIVHTTKTLLAVGGIDIGDCSYRRFDTAVAAALYASTRITGSLVETDYTQQEIATITDVSQNPISKSYTAYIEVFDELTAQRNDLQS